MKSNGIQPTPRYFARIQRPHLHHIGGSRRRGRLASIRYFAAMLAGKEVESS